MTRFLGAVVATALVMSGGRGLLAAAPDAKAVIEKACKALGGEAKLNSVKAVETKGKGSLNLGGTEGTFTTKSVVQGLDHFRQEFEGDFGGNQVKGITVVAGDKGWRQFGGTTGKLEDDMLANQKRAVYLQAVPSDPQLLNSKGFKVESTKEDKVDNKPVVVLKCVGPDKKDFELFFDADSGLPLKLIATVAGLQGDEFTQESIFTNYKEFDGLKRATKVQNKHNGEKYIDIELTDFKVLDKVDPKTFTEPPAE
jgi:hypothetical protein